MDFTLRKYKNLLIALQSTGHTFQRFDEFIDRPQERAIILRHDVDARNRNSLEFARIQHESGIRGTFYFRMVKGSYNVSLITEIAEMGHEIGYHYEDMDMAKGDLRLAVDLFERHLGVLREVASIRTICMHGSPRSKYDNREIWKVIDYRNYGIVGEPYFDLNFNDVFYLTDTGRSWNGSSQSVRDKVVSDKSWPVANSTDDIISLIMNKSFPDRVMFNFHPQRWNDNILIWFWEKYYQSLKNTIKRNFYVRG